MVYLHYSTPIITLNYKQSQPNTPTLVSWDHHQKYHSHSSFC